jgi:hypothetical protein
VLGEPSLREPLLVSAHAQDPFADVFSTDAGARSALHAALRAIAAEGRGALLYLASPAPTTESHGPGDALIAATRRAHVITQILRDLGARAILAAPAA